MGRTDSKSVFYIAAFVILLLLSCREKDEGLKPSLSGEEQEWLSAHRDDIYFAPDPFYAPFEFYDEKDGVTRGLAHEYITLLQEKLGVQFREIHASSFSQILSFAKERKVSIVNAATKTPERSEYLLFTDPIIEIKNIILVRKDKSRNISLKDLYGKKVSLVQGYAITEYLTKNYTGIKYDIVPADLNAILNVSYRISDAAVIDMATASYLTEREGITNIHVAGDTGFPVRLAIGSRSDWPELNSILNKGLRAISPAEREEIYHRWIGLQTVNIFQSPEFIVAAGTILLLFIFAGAILLWNQQLKKQIFLRTLRLKNAMDDLRKSEEEHRSILITVMDGYWRSDLQGYIEEVNETYCKMSGYTMQELSGMHVSELEASESPDVVSEHIRRIIEKGEDRFETLHRRKDGSLYSVEISVQYKPSEKGFLVAFIRDITRRKEFEERINALLREKELLLKEVHHRIKNNMNTIKGLLTLQLSAEDNAAAAASIRDAESRVQSMIMLYDRLYFTNNYRELPVKDYLKSLAEEIIGSFPNRGIVKIETEIDDFILNVNTLTPIGIIVNELLTNMMKYAFPERESGVIHISASVNGRHARIIIRDNGIGIPDSINFEKPKGFGLDLVGMLTDQIGGDIKIERNNGTRFILEFDV